MKVPTKGELIHFKIQAAMRENYFDENQMKYIGEIEGHHWYLIDNQHKVRSDQFESFEITEEV